MIEKEEKDDAVKNEAVAPVDATPNEAVVEEVSAETAVEAENTEDQVVDEVEMEEPGAESGEEEAADNSMEDLRLDPTIIEEEGEEENNDEEKEMEEDAPDLTDAFDILNIFNEEASSSELGAGVHERVKLITVDPERRKDNNGNLVKKQLFLKFKKFTKEGVDVGEKEISFFLIDSAKDSAVNNLYTFIAQTRELLSVFLTEEEITESFDPLSVLYDGDNDDREDDAVCEDFTYDLIKKRVLKKEKSFTDVETAICQQFTELLKDKIGFDSKSFRLKLEESSDAKYIQIPRFDRFVEPAGVPKEESVLYTNAK